ncbi:urease accessory protein UreF [Coprinellus micaceus]|uniref:Urease accessory protein UreF n=1 Tax=Coprinellus micaceus TaxID=71717 RepID=A0A4Y7TNI5_COPMI|nr:urease accessory protein UreF [Coprinellus micaceus]
MDTDEETYLLLLLADSNLPTGSFVASSGLESYIKHGLGSEAIEPTTLTFLRDSLASYSRTTLAFVGDAHHLSVLPQLIELDNLYDAMTLNHVARRASKAQGVALLTLYSKGFTTTPSLSSYSDVGHSERQKSMRYLLDQFKLLVRREEVNGHLSVCWGALTAALGLPLARAQYLHLFLHARSLVSAAVRLNELGPYNAQQTLLHAVGPLVAVEASKCKDLRTGVLAKSHGELFDEMEGGPANTWPLGELLATRHDLQHSRIFNS